MTIVDLSILESPFFGLVVRSYGTGVSYTNQVGGTACAHPQIEGFFVPLCENLLPESAREVVRDFYFPRGDIREFATMPRDFLEAIDPGMGDESKLSHLFDIRNIRDRRILFAEAWVPVRVKPKPSEHFLCGLSGRFGYLTWDNSD